MEEKNNNEKINEIAKKGLQSIACDINWLCKKLVDESIVYYYVQTEQHAQWVDETIVKMVEACAQWMSARSALAETEVKEVCFAGKKYTFHFPKIGG